MWDERFKSAYREFSALPTVEDDPARAKTVDVLVYIAQAEIYLLERGESTLTDSQARQYRKFIKKWAANEERIDRLQELLSLCVTLCRDNETNCLIRKAPEPPQAWLDLHSKITELEGWVNG